MKASQKWEWKAAVIWLHLRFFGAPVLVTHHYTPLCHCLDSECFSDLDDLGGPRPALCRFVPYVEMWADLGGLFWGSGKPESGQVSPGEGTGLCGADLGT